MPNTNFQTIHQMGQAINEVVKQATGRDVVQNIDMDHVTVAQNRYYAEEDISGRLVSFNAGVSVPFDEVVVQIEFVQAGSGTPSPDNVRPITGWTGVSIVVSPTTNAEDGQTYNISLLSAGTVYGGILDVVNGVLTVDRASIRVRDAVSVEKRSTNTSSWRLELPTELRPVIDRTSVSVISSNYEGVSYSEATANRNNYTFIATNGMISIKDTSTTGLTVEEFTNQYGDVRFVFDLATPIEYQLTPQEITTLLGVNNVWANTGDIEVKFTNLREMY